MPQLALALSALPPVSLPAVQRRFAAIASKTQVAALNFWVTILTSSFRMSALTVLLSDSAVAIDAVDIFDDFLDGHGLE